MGHTKPQDLDDLKRELERIRTFEFLKEKSPGIFYYRARPFLHFHDKDGRRWADLKTPDGEWQKVDVPFAANVSARKRFIKAVEHAYLAMTRPAGKT